MTLTSEQYYQALKARDSRFDGCFFVGVTSTKIYCRPICPARTPAQDRCRFFPSAAQAENQGFRPCLRCRPELAPGHAPVDATSRTARAALTRIRAGAITDGEGLENLALALGVSSRQLRRSVSQELGATPVELLQTQRLLLAKQLLTETNLPITEVAYASGFSSLRRFNSLFLERYGLNPRNFRRNTVQSVTNDLNLSLSYRPPLAWDELLDFLDKHAMARAEQIEGTVYRRTLAIGVRNGWVEVSPGKGGQLKARLSESLLPSLALVLAKLRALFDLDANPQVIDAHLSFHRRCQKSVERTPGMRVPGSTDGFELAWRTVLGQQISVVAATRLAARTVEALGEPIKTPFPSLDRLSPTPESFLMSDEETLGQLGWIRARSKAVKALAVAHQQGELPLTPGDDPEQSVAKLLKFPGVGPWTAHYLAMRGLGWSDGWPVGDAILKKQTQGTGLPDPTWKPWSAYAAMRLWYPASDAT